jgi:TPR repeat protein
MLQVLIRRGDEMMAIGDISAARRLYERAATAGSARAATAAGRTYDPEFLAGVGARGIAGEPEMARSWYQRAAELGDEEGRARLARLGSRP